MLTEHKFDTVHWQDAGDGLGRRAVYIVTVCPQLPLRLFYCIWLLRHGSGSSRRHVDGVNPLNSILGIGRWADTAALPRLNFCLLRN